MRIIIERNFYNKPQFWIWAVIVFNCTYKAMINYLHMPNVINYLNDIMCIVLLVTLIGDSKKGNFWKATGIAGILVSMLFVETIIGYLLHIYKPIVYVWGIRILFRFLVFFLACICYCNKKMIESVIRFLYYILILSVPLTTIQYAAGYSLDSVTGFFSTSANAAGGSAGQNILMCVVCSYSILQYFNKKCSAIKMLIPVLASVYMSAIGEIKFYYFELIFIIIICTFLTRMSAKKIFGLLGLVCVFLLGLNLYNSYYGSGYYYTSRGITFFSIEAVLEYIGVDGATYGSSAILNRTTAIPYVWKYFLTDVGFKLFGLGAGYADTVSSDIFSSGFLRSHSGLGYQYWITSLELANIGLIGLLLCFAIIISSYIVAAKTKMMYSDCKELCELTQVTAILAVLLMFYNQSFILDITAPILFVVLAIPYAMQYKNKIMGEVL